MNSSDLRQNVKRAVANDIARSVRVKAYLSHVKENSKLECDYFDRQPTGYIVH